MDSSPDPRIERTRRLVLDAAVETVATMGFDNATIEGIADRCGVARSTIYRHWDNKEQLVLEAMKSRLIESAPQPTGDLRTDLIAFLTATARWLGTPEGAMMALAIVSAAQRDADIRRAHAEGTRAKREQLVAILERGVATGELPAHLDTTEAANDIVGPLMYRRLITHEPVDDEYIAARTDRWLAANRV